MCTERFCYCASTGEAAVSSDLQQGGGRVSLQALAQLVHLVQQEDRVVDAYSL